MGKRNNSDELVIANKKLIFEDKEKQKRAAELAIANKELIFQTKEKQKRAAELVIANKELVFQTKEKKKRADELLIANKELVFQNEEKEKRALELIIANKEIAYQTELAKHAAELEAVNKELESFTYSVSHDLRAPLRAINGFTKVFLEDYRAQFDEDAKEILEEIIVNSKKMGELIDNLLEFSHVGKKHVSMVIIDMQELISCVIKELKQQDPHRTISFDIKKLHNIKGDKNMMKQVFINLLSNAVKYTSKIPRACIEIGSSNSNGFCTYYVKDNGAGFDMRYYDKLFGVFQRLHSSNEFEGTGVGLAIIQKIISKHNGKVWAQGKVDEGACFYISMPNIKQ